MNKLLKCLKQSKKLIMTHVVCGYPTLDESEKIIETMSKSGADIIEIQMPFSDPVADGPVIMHANEIALKNNISTKNCIDLLKKLNKKIESPLLLMGYFNTVFNYGTEKFCKDAKQAGCQGLIIPDMPIDEEKEEKFFALCKKYQLATILVVAPNTSNVRLKKINKYANGFLYCTARAGITGEKTDFKKDFEKYIKNVKEHIKIPIAVGFGISEKSQVNIVHKNVEIAIIGSALINIYKHASENKKLNEVSKFIKNLK